MYVCYNDRIVFVINLQRFSVSVFHRRRKHELLLPERARHDRHRPHEHALREPGRGHTLLDVRRGVAELRGHGTFRSRDNEPGPRAAAEHELHKPAAVREHPDGEPGVRSGLQRQTQ